MQESPGAGFLTAIMGAGLLDWLRLLAGRGAIAFFRSLEASAAAGISPARAVELAAAAQPAFEPAARDALERLRLGLPLSAGLERHPGTFPPWQVEIIKAGEATGRLDSSFRTISEILEERRSFLLTMMPGLAYPLVLLHLAPLFLFGAQAFMGHWGSFLGSCLLFLGAFYAPALAAALFLRCWLQEGRRAASTPLWRAFIKAQFSFQLSALLKAGVSFPRAVEVAAAASGLGGAAAAAASAHGLGVAERLATVGLYAPEELAQIASAEVSGDVDTALARLSQQAKSLWQSALKAVAVLIPVLVYFGVAAAVAYKIIGFYMGYWKSLGELGL